jgi:hypothetical protein
MMNLKQAVDHVLARLQDSDNAIWSRAQIERYIIDGYDQFTRQTLCIWDVAYAEDLPYTGTHQSYWEEPYMTLFHNRFNFTGGEWEREYAGEDALGPANHTAAWERDYITTDFISATAKLPETMLEIERVTHDQYKVDADYSMNVGAGSSRYETESGNVMRYVFDRDGIFTIRKVAGPATESDEWETSGTYGVLREADDEEFGASQTVVGSYGVLRSAPVNLASGSVGTPRRVYRDGHNTKVEFFRRGRDLRKHPFEIPDRYVKRGVALYAMGMARNQPGKGQDKKLGAHYLQRFGLCVARLKARMARLDDEKVRRMTSGQAPQSSRPALAQLPWRYPRIPSRLR